MPPTLLLHYICILCDNFNQYLSIHSVNFYLLHIDLNTMIGTRISQVSETIANGLKSMNKLEKLKGEGHVRVLKGGAYLVDMESKTDGGSVVT